jgi:BASS family bile acid:Na+ symporter
MVAIGMGVTWTELIAAVANYRRLAGALIANYIGVPMATVGLLLLVKPAPTVAAGFLILAVCPGGPFIPPTVATAKGNVALAVSLMAVLAASSAVLAPPLLCILLPFLSSEEPLAIDSTRLAMTLLLTQLLPLCVGLAVRHWRPVLATRLQPSANAVGKYLIILALISVLAIHYQQLANIQLRGLLGMTMLLIASLVVGWLLSDACTATRRTLALVAGVRNVGVSLAIATNAFPGTPAVTAVLAFGLFGTAGSLAMAGWWSRR